MRIFMIILCFCQRESCGWQLRSKYARACRCKHKGLACANVCVSLCWRGFQLAMMECAALCSSRNVQPYSGVLDDARYLHARHAAAKARRELSSRRYAAASAEKPQHPLALKSANQGLTRQSLNYSYWKGVLLVDLIGIEPMTSSMPWKRAPSCATGPLSGRTSLIL
jgi:hypothetical protein